MTSHRLEMKLDTEEDKILLPLSSDDEQESNSELSEEEHVIEDPFANEDSDSDGAPDAVSFKSALEDSRTLKRQTTQVIRTQLEERRKKRKEIHDQYMLLKQEKRQKIESNKLPDDILEKLNDEPVPERNLSQNYEISEDQEEPTEAILTKEIVSIHGPTMFKCKVSSVESKKPKYISEKVANFKEHLLFGSRIRREKSTRAAMLKSEKQLVNRRPKCVH